jgi:hypothetical protein
MSEGTALALAGWLQAAAERVAWWVADHDDRRASLELAPDGVEVRLRQWVRTHHVSVTEIVAFDQLAHARTNILLTTVERCVSTLAEASLKPADEPVHARTDR